MPGKEKEKPKKTKRQIKSRKTKGNEEKEEEKENPLDPFVRYTIGNEHFKIRRDSEITMGELMDYYEPYNLTIPLFPGTSRDTRIVDFVESGFEINLVQYQKVVNFVFQHCYKKSSTMELSSPETIHQFKQEIPISLFHKDAIYEFGKSQWKKYQKEKKGFEKTVLNTLDEFEITKIRNSDDVIATFTVVTTLSDADYDHKFGVSNSYYLGDFYDDIYNVKTGTYERYRPTGGRKRSSNRTKKYSRRLRKY